MRTHRWAERARELCLTVAALVGSLCLLSLVAAVAVDVRPLIFRSGSMAPAIETGDLAFVRTVPASELEPGDIVSVVNGHGERVTHRLVQAETHAGRYTLILRGDANPAADDETYPATEAERVLFTLPWVGRAVGAISSPIGLVVAGGLLFPIVFGVPKGLRDATAHPKHVRGARKRCKGRAARTVVRCVALVGAALLCAASARAWAGPWKDDVPVTHTTFASYEVARPAIVSCSVSGLITKTATIVWNEVSSPYALDYGAQVVETGLQLGVVDLGSTRRVQVSEGLLGTIFGETATVRITAYLPSPNGAWHSVPSTQKLNIGLLGLGMSCGARA